MHTCLGIGNPTQLFRVVRSTFELRFRVCDGTIAIPFVGGPLLLRFFVGDPASASVRVGVLLFIHSSNGLQPLVLIDLANVLLRLVRPRVEIVPDVDIDMIS